MGALGGSVHIWGAECPQGWSMWVVSPLWVGQNFLLTALGPLHPGGCWLGHEEGHGRTAWTLRRWGQLGGPTGDLPEAAVPLPPAPAVVSPAEGRRAAALLL